MEIITDINRAVQILKNGGVIAYPTETFYGLGCSAFNEEALTRIYEIKERSLTQPLPLIVSDFKQVLELANINENIYSSVKEITDKFWAGSLSILFNAKDCVSPIITANTRTIVIRQSPHALCQQMTTLLNAPIVSTSANKSGEKPAQFAHELDKSLSIDAILDIERKEDEPQGGLPSTIIEVLPNKKIRPLRTGAFDLSKLEKLGYSILER